MPLMSQVVDGRVLSGRQLQEYALEQGLCPTCGVRKTHKIKRKGFLGVGVTKKPLTEKGEDGKFTVYKGHCIAPTCYTSLDQIRQKLGEDVSRKPSTNEMKSGDARSVGSRSSASSSLSEIPSAPPDTTPTSCDSSGSSPLQSPKDLQRSQDVSNHDQDSTEENGSGSLYSVDFAGRVYNSFGTENNATPSNTTQKYNNHSHNQNGAASPQQNAQRSHRHLAHHQQYQNSISNLNSSSYRMRQSYQDPLEVNRRPHSRQSHASSRNFYNVNNSNSTSSSSSAGPISNNSTSQHERTLAHNVKPTTSELLRHSDLTVNHLEQLAADGGYMEFFNELGENAKSPDIVDGGFRIIERYVVMRGTDRLSDFIVRGMIKTIKDCLENFKGNDTVIVTGIHCFQSFASIPGNYRKTMVKKGVVGLIMDIMEEFRDNHTVEEICCSTIELLSQNPRDHLTAKHFDRIVALVQRLTYIMTNSGFGARRHALCSLHNLASQKKKSEVTGKSIMYDVRKAVLKEDAVLSLLSLINHGDSTDEVGLAGLSLVWRLSVEDISSSIILNASLIENITSAMERFFNSPGVFEAGCGALANLSMDPMFPTELSSDTAAIVCRILKKAKFFGAPESSKCALHALCNLLSKWKTDDSVAPSFRRQRLDPNVFPTLVELIRQNSYLDDCVEHGCFAICYAGADDEEGVDLMVSNGGFELIIGIFQEVLSRPRRPEFEVMDGILCAIATLSNCRSGAQKVAEEPGLIDMLDSMLITEQDTRLKNTLNIIIRNGHRKPPPPTPVLTNYPNQFAQLLKDADSEEAVVSVLREGSELGGILSNVMEDSWVDIILNRMMILMESSDVLIYSFSIIANYTADRNNARGILCENGLQTILQGIYQHKENSEVVHSGMDVLFHTLGHMTDADYSSIKPEIRSLLIDFVGPHTEIEGVATVSMKLIETCLVRDSSMIDTFSASEDMIQGIVSTMERHVSVLEIQRYGCNILRLLGNSTSSKELIGRRGGVLVIANALTCHIQSSNAVITGLSTLKSLSMVSSNKPLIAQVGAEEVVLNAMQVHIDKPEVLSAAFAAINNMAVDSKTRTVSELRDDVLSIVIQAMHGYLNDKNIQKNACFLLKSSSYLPSNLQLMRLNADRLLPLLLSASEIFPNECHQTAMGVVSKITAHVN